MTPLIDVMLVLLVIFMVTAPLVTPGVIDLPTVGKAGQPKSVPLEVIVKEDQTMIVRERATHTTAGSRHAHSAGRASLPAREWSYR